MKTKLTALIACFLIGACANQNQAVQLGQALTPIAIAAASAYLKLPPTSSTAINNAANQLWGMYAQAQAGQPISQGSAIAALGAAVASAIPAGTSQSQIIAALQTAATLAQNNAATPSPVPKNAYRWNDHSHDWMLCKLPTLESESGAVIPPFSECGKS